MTLWGGIKHSSSRLLTSEDISAHHTAWPVRLREGLSVLEDNQSNLSEQVAPSRRNVELDKENMYFPNEESGNRDWNRFSKKKGGWRGLKKETGLTKCFPGKPTQARVKWPQ